MIESKALETRVAGCCASSTDSSDHIHKKICIVFFFKFVAMKKKSHRKNFERNFFPVQNVSINSISRRDNILGKFFIVFDKLSFTI